MKTRIGILDGFRALAVIAVLLYHFYSRWDNTKDPYFNKDYFHYGFTGVWFFFIISGFVISHTLHATSGFMNFWIKRIIRLLPSMVIASTITFLFVRIWDINNLFPDAHLIQNYFISFTFILPHLFDYLIDKPWYFSYLNYSYWSLWPEIQFYFFASIIYYIQPLKYVRNMFVIGLLMLLTYTWSISYQGEGYNFITKASRLFNLIEHLRLFICGLLIYDIFQRLQNKISFRNSYIGLMTMLATAIFLPENEQVIFLLISLPLFILFLHKPEVLWIFNFQQIRNIGVASYFIYLIHEYIGVLIIQYFQPAFLHFQILLPIFMIALICMLSIMYTRYIDNPIQKQLKRILFPS